MRAAVQPCVVAFWLLRFLPSGVLGPLLWRALRWLASRFAAETLIRDIERGPSFPAQLYIPSPNLWLEVVNTPSGGLARSGCELGLDEKFSDGVNADREFPIQPI